MVSVDSTVVRHFTHNPKFQGSSLAAAGNGGRK